MQRDFLVILAALGISAGIAGAANIGWHKMEWIRVSRAVESPDRIPNPTSKPADLPPPPQGLTADEVLEHVQNGSARLVDARESEDYAAGHLRDAINLPTKEVTEKIDNLRSVVGTGEKIIVYCGGVTCEAAEHVADSLRLDYGYQDVTVYKNGWDEITSSGKFLGFIVTGE